MEKIKCSSEGLFRECSGRSKMSEIMAEILRELEGEKKPDFLFIFPNKCRLFL